MTPRRTNPAPRLFFDHVTPSSSRESPRFESPPRATARDFERYLPRYALAISLCDEAAGTLARAGPVGREEGGRGGGPTRNAASSSLACIHDPNPVHTGAAHPPIARTPVRGAASAPARKRTSSSLHGGEAARLLRRFVHLVGHLHARISDPRRRAASRRVTSRDRPLCTGTRLPGAHNYRARWHTTMRVSRERFTMAYVSLSLPLRARSLSFSRFPSRSPSLSADLGPLSGPYQRIEGSDASAPSTKIAGGPRSPSLLDPLSRHPPQRHRTRLHRIVRSPAAGDTLRRFRSFNTVPPPPWWPVFELQAKPTCLHRTHLASRATARIELRKRSSVGPFGPRRS